MKITAVVFLSLVLLLTGQPSCSGDQQTKKKETIQSKSDETKAEAPKAPELKRPGIRDENNKLVTIETDFGNMTLELYRDVAPAHADSFVARTVEGFYDSLLFFRIVDGFMIQGGDPSNNGTGNAGYYLNAEFSDLPHMEGTLSMARARAPNSASCQFFLCLDRERVRQLDREYTVFGQLIKGYDVLHKIGSVEVGPNRSREMSKPKKDVHMIRVFLSDAEGNELKDK